MEHQAPEELVSSVRRGLTEIQKIKFGLLEEIQRIEKDPNLSRVGKDQTQAVLRRDARAKAVPLATAAQTQIADAEKRKASWSLDAYLQAQEFAAITEPVEAMQRVHFAAILPRTSVEELAALMADAVERQAFWRVAMVRRECRARLRETELLPSQRPIAVQTIAAAEAVAPLDVTAIRAALDELQRMGDAIRVQMNYLGGLAIAA